MGMGGVFTDSNSAKVFGSREDYNRVYGSLGGPSFIRSLPWLVR